MILFDHSHTFLLLPTVLFKLYRYWFLRTRGRGNFQTRPMSMGSEKPGHCAKVYLRFDQKISDIGSKTNIDPNVTIFAPEWIRSAFEHFRPLITKNSEYKIVGKSEETITKRLENDVSLKDLIMFARNEPSNVTGIVSFKLITPLIEDLALIYSLKDLIRQCIIIGRDKTTHYGGYGSGKPTPQKKEVILIDSIGLQFQRMYNTGRLVLIGNQVIKGPLDDLILTNVVGHPKKSVEEVRQDTTGRFVKSNNLYFDTYAYEMFVAHDFILVSLALNKMDIPEVNLKFLKYGTGFFAGAFGYILERHISRGVYRGLEILFESGKNEKIKSFEFPFYKNDPQIIELCKKHGVKCRFSVDDALKQSHPNLITATTNCADPHAVTGNEMGYSSVDSAIAQNLKSKANKFSPVLNTQMREQFIELPFIRTKVSEQSLEELCHVKSNDILQDNCVNKTDENANAPAGPIQDNVSRL